MARAAPRLRMMMPLVAARVVVVLLALLAAGCSADRDFDNAARTNTTVAWDDYLRAHPDGAHAREARERLAALLEDSEWQRAHAADTVDAYQRYLRSNPQGAHAHDALVALAHLNLAATPASETAAAPAAPAAPVAASPPVATRPATGAIERQTPAPVPAATPAAASRPTAAHAAKPASPAPARAPAAAPARARGTSPQNARPAATGTYRVQLGAFAGGSAAAERAWQGLEGRYPELKGNTPLIAAARAADGRPIYRLQLTGLDRPAAESLCAAFAVHHDPCVLVPPVELPSKPPH